MFSCVLSHSQLQEGSRWHSMDTGKTKCKEEVAYSQGRQVRSWPSPSPNPSVHLRTRVSATGFLSLPHSVKLPVIELYQAAFLLPYCLDEPGCHTCDVLKLKKKFLNSLSIKYGTHKSQPVIEWLITLFFVRKDLRNTY